MNGRLRGIAGRIDTNVEELLDFLDSPSGRRLRKRLAAGLIISVPLVMRIPGLRRTRSDGWSRWLAELHSS